jgi:hypothetical protein
MTTSLIHNSHDDFSASGAQQFSNINPVLKRQLNSFAGCCR